LPFFFHFFAKSSFASEKTHFFHAKIKKTGWHRLYIGRSIYGTRTRIKNGSLVRGARSGTMMKPVFIGAARGSKPVADGVAEVCPVQNGIPAEVCPVPLSVFSP
jgi:hypothetical protein